MGGDDQVAYPTSVSAKSRIEAREQSRRKTAGKDEPF
jgi:hypothetical protein